MKSLFNARKYKPDKLYGTVTVGSRGQVVIPVQARKDLKIKPGDRLMVVGKLDKILSVFKAEQMGELVEIIMETAAGTPYEKEIREHLYKTYGSPKKPAI